MLLHTLFAFLSGCIFSALLISVWEYLKKPTASSSDKSPPLFHLTAEEEDFEEASKPQVVAIATKTAAAHDQDRLDAPDNLENLQNSSKDFTLEKIEDTNSTSIIHPVVDQNNFSNSLVTPSPHTPSLAENLNCNKEEKPIKRFAKLSMEKLESFASQNPQKVALFIIDLHDKFFELENQLHDSKVEAIKLTTQLSEMENRFLSPPKVRVFFHD